MMNRYFSLLFFSLLLFVSGPVKADSCDLYPLDRMECGHFGINEGDCHSKGCCWAPYAINTRIPWCFHKVKQCDGYYANNFAETNSMITAELSILNDQCNRFGRNIRKLDFFLEFETDSRIHLKITDAEKHRWEIPEQVVPISKPQKRSDWFVEKNGTGTFIVKGKGYNRKIQPKKDLQPNMKMTKESRDFRVELSSRPFNFAIIRKIDGQTIFNTSSGSSDVLVFEEQFLEISTGLPDDANIYGLGESIRPYKLNPEETRATLFARDAASPVDQNLYGAHPFYMEMRNGRSHGVVSFA